MTRRIVSSLGCGGRGADRIQPEGLVFHGGEGSVPSLGESDHRDDHPGCPVGEFFQVCIFDQIEFRTMDGSRPQSV